MVYIPQNHFIQFQIKDFKYVMESKTAYIAKQRTMMKPIDKILDQYPPEVVKSPEVPAKLKKYLKEGNKILITAKYANENTGDRQCV
jgi:hypothetical protein